MNAPNNYRSTTPLLQRLDWRLVVSLAAIALVRPLLSALGISDALGEPATPLILTAVISVVWILVVGLSRVREPVLTLVGAGVVYALATIVVSAILSPILDGELRGPLATPVAIPAVLVFNAAWGAVCGVCAMGLRNMRGVRS